MIKVKFNIDQDDSDKYYNYDLDKFKEVYITFNVEGEPFIEFVNKDIVIRNKVVILDNNNRVEDTLDEF